MEIKLNNSGLNRIPNGRFDHGREQALRSTKANLELMIKYPNVFNSMKDGKKILGDMKDIKLRLKRESFLTEKQMDYVEKVYEKFWTAMSKIKNDELLAGVPTKHDFVKKY